MAPYGARYLAQAGKTGRERRIHPSSLAAAPLMHADTLSRITEAAGACGLDAVIAMSPANVAYLAGNRLLPPHRPPTRHLMLVARPAGEMLLFAPEAEAALVARDHPGIAFAGWSQSGESAMESLAGALWDLSLSTARIGIETDFLAAGDLLVLGAALPRAEFVAAEGLFTGARLTKTEREIALIRRIARIADEAVATALGACEAGVAEHDVAGELVRAVHELGGEGCPTLCVASGPPASRSPVPGTRVFGAGEEVRIELAVQLGGYHALVRRSRLVGPAPEQEAARARAAHAAASLAAMIGPGAGSRDIARAYIRAIAPLEAPPRDMLAHGIGLDLREAPGLVRGENVVLEEGMVLVLRPLVHESSDGFDLPSKEMVVVTGSGAERLTGEGAGAPAQAGQNR